MAAMMLETYCFLELRDDIISVICGGCVVLISGYLFLDTIRVDILKQREDYYQKSLENEERMNKELVEMVKFQKATYITSKKSISTEAMSKDMLEGQMKAVKVMMKYSKEHSDAIISNSHQDTTQLMKAIMLELAELNSGLKDDNNIKNNQQDRMLDIISEGMVELNDRVDQLIRINQQQIPKDSFKDSGSVIHFERRENI